MELHNFEFYGTTVGQVMISSADSSLKVYEQTDREFTVAMIERISEFYPEAMVALSKTYESSRQNLHYYEYLIVHRFIRCNFNEYDSRADIDSRGCFRFEFVSCPLRGECKYCNIICNPSFNAKLSPREQDVMKLYYQGLGVEEISERLFISMVTVKKHKRNALERLKMHSLNEFLTYANKNRLFENE
jgi:DNA-binding CsgD family transcriptional regulator